MSEQDDLFAGLEGVVVRPATYVDKGVSRKPSTHGGCPRCTNEKVGLVIQAGHYAWVDHWVATYGGNARQCLAGGQRLCDEPARDMRFATGLKTPTCICTTERTPDA